LGEIPLPALRFFEFGFPGSQSLIANHLVQTVEVAPGVRAQTPYPGVGGVVYLEPAIPGQEYFTMNGQWGTAQRRWSVSGPGLLGNGFTLAGGYLSNDVLSAYGRRFFATSRKDPATCDSACIPVISNPFQMSASDFYFQSATLDSAGSFSRMQWLGVFDSYTIRQDLSYRFQFNQPVEIVAGNTRFISGSYLHKTADDRSYYGYLGVHTQGQTLRDTLLQSTSLMGNLLDSTRGEHYYFGGGASFNPSVLRPVGVLHTQLLLGVANWYFIDSARIMERQDPMHQGRLFMEKHWPSVGVRANYGVQVQSKQVAPMADARIDLPFAGEFLYFAQAQLSGKDIWARLAPQELYTGAPWQSSVQTGLKYLTKHFAVQGAGYARYYNQPELPLMVPYGRYQNLRSARSAQVVGAWLETAAKPSRYWRAHVRGGYTHGEYWVKQHKWQPWELPLERLPWESEGWQWDVSLRWFPTADSTWSLAVLHQGAAQVPLFAYRLDHQTRERSVYLHTLTRYARTDLKGEFTLPGKLRPLDVFKMYVQLTNPFSVLPFEWAKYLGGSNLRQRGWHAVQQPIYSKSVMEVTPGEIPGVGLFLEFGAQGQFSF
jgi:hypothetical protein